MLIQNWLRSPAHAIERAYYTTRWLNLTAMTQTCTDDIIKKHFSINAPISSRNN